MFTQHYYKLAMLALTLILTAILSGVVVLCARHTTQLPIVREAVRLVNDNMPAVNEADSLLNQYNKNVDKVLNFDVMNN